MRQCDNTAMRQYFYCYEYVLLVLIIALTHCPIIALTMFSYSPLLNAFLIICTLENAMHEYPRCMNFVRVQFSGFYQFFYFSNSYLSCHSHHRVEVAGCIFKYK